MAKPSPDPAPVTSARRPVRSKGCAGDIPCSRSAQTENVLHIVEADYALRALDCDETHGAQRSLREGQARGSTVGELDALSESGKDYGMVADDIAAAQRSKADSRGLALAGDSPPGVYGVALQIAMQRCCDGLAEHERCARRRVDLMPVM